MLHIADRKELVREIRKIRTSGVRSIIEKRLTEFSSFRTKTSKTWFTELCFCLLTANWKAREAIALQKKIGTRGFLEYSESQLQEILQKEGHRFHPQRAERIVLARQYAPSLKRLVTQMDSQSARRFLVDTIKGIGYKEASHFLRNVGYFDVAIIDRHILRLMDHYGLYHRSQKTITPRYYIELERICCTFADSLGMSAAELDLYIWYLATGTILK